MMNQETKAKKSRFKKNESGYHESAKTILARWMGGKVEEKFYVDGLIAFVADVAVFKDDKLECLYEVVHTHEMTGHKYGMIQLYCYRNLTEITVYEISSHFILKQTEKPIEFEVMEKYVIGPFEYDEVEECLIKSIG